MMLSPRRFWCALCLCAVLACGMLIEPIQRFAKRSAVEYAFGGSVKATNFQVHRNQELLELSAFHTTQVDDDANVNVTIDRALIKLDMPSLLDKRFHSSRVKLQGVQIELTSLQVQKPSSAAVSHWQKSFEDVISAFQWDNLRDDCEALLKSDNVLNELDNKMRGWLLRSQQIMFHGNQLTRAIQAYSNPLRHQNEIRNQLAQLVQLRLEQDNIQKQFSGVSAILTSHLKEILLLGEQDLIAIRSKCDRTSSSLRTVAAEQIVTEWAKQLVFRQLQLSQAFATLLQSDTRTNPYNVDIRSAATQTPLISLTEIVAIGSIEDSMKQLPFTATGQYSTVQKVDYQIGRNTTWQILFDADQVTTQLELASVATDSSWNVKSTSSESPLKSVSASDLSIGVKQKSDAADGVGMLELDATIGNRRLSGKVRMNLGMYSAFAKLPCKVNADLASTELSADSTTVPSDADWIEFTLTGSASDAKFSLNSSLPAEFTNTITDKIQKQLELQRKESESKLKLALKSKIDELSKQLELLSRNGQDMVAKQREALTTMHRELELNLQSREGVEYARLPLKPNTNH